MQIKLSLNKYLIFSFSIYQLVNGNFRAFWSDLDPLLEIVELYTSQYISNFLLNF